MSITNVKFAAVQIEQLINGIKENVDKRYYLQCLEFLTDRAVDDLPQGWRVHKSEEHNGHRFVELRKPAGFGFYKVDGFGKNYADAMRTAMAKIGAR